jgi:drug/metabolite transporter (DMT)-like permease
MVLAVVLALVCAVLQALSNVLQHHAVAGSGAGAPLLPLLRNRVWLLGFMLIVLAFPFQIAALAVGSVAVVQPVLVTILVFVLPFAALISHVRITSRDWASALAVTIGLAAFLAAAAPTEGDATPSSGAWVLACAGTLVLCLVCIATGRRMPAGPSAALIIGTAGGLINGLVGPVTKGAVTVLDEEGPLALLSNGLLYATIVTALLGVVFPLLAFQAGPITASMPTITLFNPLTAAFLGWWLFGDQIRYSPVALAVAGAGVALMTAGVIVISRSEAVAESFETGSLESP